MNGFTRWPDFYQGIAYMIAGLIILLYALGILGKGVTVAVIVCASVLIAIGCVKIGLYEKILTMFNRVKRHR